MAGVPAGDSPLSRPLPSQGLVLLLPLAWSSLWQPWALPRELLLPGETRGAAPQHRWAPSPIWALPKKRDPRCQQPPAPQLLGLGSARLHPPGAQHKWDPHRGHQEQQPQEDIRECKRSLGGWSAAGTLSSTCLAFNIWQNSKITRRKQGLKLTRAASLGRKLS